MAEKRYNAYLIALEISGGRPGAISARTVMRIAADLGIRGTRQEGEEGRCYTSDEATRVRDEWVSRNRGDHERSIQARKARIERKRG